MQNNVLDYLEGSLARVPDKIAYADDDVQLTFSDVKTVRDGISDVASIQEQAKSMASSYEYPAQS